MRPRTTGGIVLAVAFAAAALGVIAAGAPRAAAPAVAASASPAPEGAPSPTPSPAPPGGTPAAPPAAPEATTSPVAPALPRIIRTVCTDHVCGGCDGKCRATTGHVAIDKKGHCACTPTEGSDLDRAVRQAYERHPPQ